MSSKKIVKSAMLSKKIVKSAAIEAGKEQLGFMFDIMTRKLDGQSSAHLAVESKVNVLFGFVAAIMAVLLSFIWDNPELLMSISFAFGLLGLFATIGFLVFSSKTRIYLDPPDFECFYSEKAFSENLLVVKNQVLADMKDSYETNMRNHLEKTRFYNYALFTLVFSLAFLFLGIVQAKIWTFHTIQILDQVPHYVILQCQ